MLRVLSTVYSHLGDKTFGRQTFGRQNLSPKRLSPKRLVAQMTVHRSSSETVQDRIKVTIMD